MTPPTHPADAVCPRRLLVVLRHAHAESSLGSDVARALSPRGRAGAEAAAREIARRHAGVEVVVTSPARRARETAQAVMQVLAASPSARAPSLREDSTVYEASLADLVDVVRGLPPDAATVVLVGHNPGLGTLVDRLCAGPRPLLPGGLVPAGMVALEIAGDWLDVAQGCARWSWVWSPPPP